MGFESRRLLLLISISVHVFLCPFTKVEESFNLQATHDVLYHHFDIDSYDHLEFPGVVPRTFFGPLIIATLSSPFNLLLRTIQAPKLCSQYLSRLVLGSLSYYSIIYFQDSVSAKFSKRAGNLTIMLLALQFHVPFYASRTLPNTFALIVCLLAYSSWIKGMATRSLVFLAFAMIVFRCDFLVLMAPLVLLLLSSREIPFWVTLGIGIAFSTCFLLSTILIDSFFWKRWLWPEGIVLFFNTVENKSSEWGIMPWHWYVSNALPKALHISLILAVLGIAGIRYPRVLLNDAFGAEPAPSSWLQLLVSCLGPINWRLLYYCSPVIAFVALYSFLPHKELRFIFPALPVLTMAAAVGLDSILPPEPVKSVAHQPNALKDNQGTKAAVPSSLLFPLNLLLESGDKSSSSSSSISSTETAPVVGGGGEVPGGAELAAKQLAGAQQAQSIGGKRVQSSIVASRVRAVNTVISIGTLGLLLLSVILSSLFCLASYHNYPGGVALQRLLHSHIPRAVVANQRSSDTDTDSRRRLDQGRRLVYKIHIDVPAAMSGVSRFGQEDASGIWELKAAQLQSKFQSLELEYSKEEKLTEFSQFDWLITGNTSEYGKDAEFVVRETIHGFKKFSLSRSLRLQVDLQPSVYIMERSQSSTAR